MKLNVILLGFIGVVLLVSEVTSRPPISPRQHTDTILSYDENELKYNIGIISDLDKLSKDKDENNQNIWISNLKLGSLIYNSYDNYIKIKWSNTTIKLKSKNNFKGRGMELSELIKFNGHLLSFDDHTGIVYEIDLDKKETTALVTLMDGDGTAKKPFKTEWASVKDKKLYVGSTGFEWINYKTKKVSNKNAMYVKTIESNGKVDNVDWIKKYDAMRSAANLSFPGFIWHEAGVWSDKHNEWFFLPRKCSDKLFDVKTEDKIGCNLLLRADESFENINITEIKNINGTHGYSSFKFVPNTDDQIIVALSTREVDFEGQQTFIVAFTIDGETLLDEEEVSDTEKYEGIEFI